MKTIKVRIIARETMHYSQIVEMDIDDWKRIKKLDELELADNIEGYIDRSNPNYADDLECDELYACDADGKPVSPRDKYTAGGDF